MENCIIELFEKNGIEFYNHIPIKNCKFIKKYLLKDEDYNSVYVFLVPYLTKNKTSNYGISKYANSLDYHLYFNNLFNEINKYYDNSNFDFKGFSDHSPIDEVHAALIAGLGYSGKNGLLINKKYGSFVFIGEIFSKEKIDSFKPFEIKKCLNCGLCLKKCPSCLEKRKCLSGLSQKKGDLSLEELSLLSKNNIIWGCDLCQDICPMNKNIMYSNIPFFYNNLISKLTINELEEMDNNIFNQRAFSWKGKEVLLRNIKNIIKNI